MPSPASAARSGSRLAGQVRQRKLGERSDSADTEFDLVADGQESFFGARQLKILRIMTVIQVFFLMGFAHIAVSKKTGIARQFSSAVRHVTEESLPVMIAAHPEGILVNFHTEACSHCVTLAPEYEVAAQAVSKDTSDSSTGKVVFASIDTALNPKAAASYGVTHLPTMLWFRKGVRIQEVPSTDRTAKKIADFVASARAPAIVDFGSRKELEDSLPELRAALPNGGIPVIVGFSPILADADAEKPGVIRQDVHDVLEIVAERMRGQTVFLYSSQESWARDPSLRAYYWDASLDQDYNGTITTDSVQAWVKDRLTKKPKKASSAKKARS